MGRDRKGAAKSPATDTAGGLPDIDAFLAARASRRSACKIRSFPADVAARFDRVYRSSAKPGEDGNLSAVVEYARGTDYEVSHATVRRHFMGLCSCGKAAR